MWEDIKAKIKAVCWWIYNWMTIITVSLVGLPSMLLEFLTYLGGVNLEPLVGQERALQIITYVAIIKSVLAVIQSRVNQPDKPEKPKEP